MNNSDDVFLKQMKVVNPIKKTNRIKKENPKNNYITEKKKKNLKLIQKHEKKT